MRNKKKDMKKHFRLTEQEFMGYLEEMTDELIEELHHQKGWELENLKSMQLMGMFYCRESNSFFPNNALLLLI
jgi:hypothetical protein